METPIPHSLLVALVHALSSHSPELLRPFQTVIGAEPGRDLYTVPISAAHADKIDNALKSVLASSRMPYFGPLSGTELRQQWQELRGKCTIPERQD